VARRDHGHQRAEGAPAMVEGEGSQWWCSSGAFKKDIDICRRQQRWYEHTSRTFIPNLFRAKKLRRRLHGGG
jgi:hypothetical protein